MKSNNTRMTVALATLFPLFTACAPGLDGAADDETGGDSDSEADTTSGTTGMGDDGDSHAGATTSPAETGEGEVGDCYCSLPMIPCGPHGTYHPETHSCECVEGWGGSGCTECAQGWFGPACDQAESPHVLGLRPNDCEPFSPNDGSYLHSSVCTEGEHSFVFKVLGLVDACSVDVEVFNGASVSCDVNASLDNGSWSFSCQTDMSADGSNARISVTCEGPQGAHTLNTLLFSS